MSILYDKTHKSKNYLIEKVMVFTLDNENIQIHFVAFIQGPL